MSAAVKYTLDDLHLAMGRFLTESSQVENMMLALVAVAQTGRPIEEVSANFMDKTFGEKIKELKKACDAYAFNDNHRALLKEAYSGLDILLPKRNFIVHGSTYEMAMGDKPPQPYRIGKIRWDAEFMGPVFANNLTGPNVFTTDGISTVTDECIAIRAKLANVATDIMFSLAKKSPNQNT
jgi:hypothetical protein